MSNGDKKRGNYLTITDVFPGHPDVVVPVRAGLFVVEPEGMQQLMLHSAVVETTLTAQRHSLTTTLTAHVRVATASAQTEQFLFHKCPLFYHGGTETQNGQVIRSQTDVRQRI